MEITHGNLFSGSGTWELAAQICGIKTLWEAEIEPFPVAVEAARFPDAIQLGDVSKISGADIPHTDSQEYKMWGNGIALPCLLPMMKAMADELDFSKHINPPEE